MELGYTVLTASDAAAALRALEESPEIRLLFTDAGLTNPLNGRQLAEIADYASDTLSRKGRLDGGMELIAKPFTTAALSAKIRFVLQR